MISERERGAKAHLKVFLMSFEQFVNRFLAILNKLCYRMWLGVWWWSVVTVFFSNFLKVHKCYNIYNISYSFLSFLS